MNKSIASKHWDDHYNTTSVTDWERLPLTDLREFIVEAQLNLKRIDSVLDVGCGRGWRTLLAALTLDELNRPNVRILGVDISTAAISTAHQVYEELRQTG